MEGFELNSEFYLPVKDLVLTFDYMYDDARDDSEGRVTNRVPEIPLHKVDTGLKYIVPRIGTKLNFDAIYIGKSYYQVPTISRPQAHLISNGTQMTFDCRISQKFMDHFEAYMAMNNMLDKNYMPEYGFPAEGRTCLVRVNGEILRFVVMSVLVLLIASDNMAGLFMVTI